MARIEVQYTVDGGTVDYMRLSAKDLAAAVAAVLQVDPASVNVSSVIAL